MFLKINRKQNKEVYLSALLIILVGVFFSTSSAVHAQGFLGDAVVAGVKWILYGVFVMFGWMASLAITIFGWAINPNYISGPEGFFNNPAIYEMWKFIRDFFNLFFILTLLYIAFTIVFQVAGDYKKSLLSLVLAALFINFSFPITRFMIDAANVPMYFFANQMLAGAPNGTPGGSLGTALEASQIKKMLIPGSESGGDVDMKNTEVSELLVAIVFIFIFSITLLVLAVMFVVRLAALLILLIFSSVGFAAAIIPGLQKYSSMWWDKFAQYAIFGPAAMLMLYIATRFFEMLNQTSDPTFRNIQQVASQNVVAGDRDFFAAMAMFSIPIILLWITIGLANSFAIAGAGSVTGAGQRFGKWVGKGAWRGTKWAGLHNPIANTARGLGSGVKERALDTKFARWVKSPSWFESGAKGVATGKGWAKGAQSAQAKHHAQEVNKKVKENKDNQVNRSNLLRDLESSNAIERQAAALSLAENGEIRSAEDLTQTLNALRTSVDTNGRNVYDEASGDMVARVIDKAKDGATAGLDQAAYAGIAGNDDFYVKDKDGKVIEKNGKKVAGAALEALNSKLKKDGAIKVRADYEINQKGDSPETRKAVYDDLIGKMSAEDVAKQKDIYKEDTFKEYASNNMTAERLREVMKKATEKSSAEAQKAWADIVDSAGTRRA